jgi:photosystem II stability/assembly factor-like uncharacterized protein
MKKFLLLPIFLFFFANASQSQIPDYKVMMFDSTLNFDSICKITQHYFDSTGLDTIPHSGYNSFKRWEIFWKPRVGNSENLGSFQPALEAFTELVTTPTICNGGSFSEDWTFVGHSVTEPDNPSFGEDYGRGQGVLNKVYVDMVNDPTGNTVYVGSRSGGLWRTRNAKCTATNCQTWVCLTNNRFPGMGVNDIIIDPTDDDVMFISTGLGGMDEQSYGMGLLKTSNGQSDNPTWSATGLTYDLNNSNVHIYTQGVFMSPSDHNTIFAFMHTKLFKSTDGGETFNVVHTLPDPRCFFRDLVFMPSNSSVILVSTLDQEVTHGGATVIKSTDNGSTWTDITTSLGFTNNKQVIDLAITPASTSLVIAAAGNFDEKEIAKSSNSGGSWTTYGFACTGGCRDDNYIGFQCSDLIVSPTNANTIYLAGDLFHKYTSTSSGDIVFIQPYGYYSGKVHPDIRDLAIATDGSGNDVIYSANDGGLDISPDGGTNWNKANGTGLNVTQIYGFDFNLNKDWITVGCQDLGFYSKDGNWMVNTHGDGYKIIFNPFSSTETMLGQNNGSIYSSTNKGHTWSSSGLDAGDRSRTMRFDAVGNLYVGHKKKLYRKSATGSTMIMIKEFTDQFATSSISGIGISKSNPNIMYIGFDEKANASRAIHKLYKTENALAEDPAEVDWEDISWNVPCNWSGITDIIVHPNDPNSFWISLGTGFTESNGSTVEDRIHFSNSGGDENDPPTFTAIAEGLAINSELKVRFPVSVMALDEATGGMYIGTDIGVFYNPDPTSATSSWSCFNRNMPTVVVTDLKIDYCNRKILASTMGRGLWESNLAEKPNKDHVLTSSTLLSVPSGKTRLFYSDITIPSGKTFVVEGIVKMAADRKITVKPGGKILINGGKITSTCDKPWAGIRIEGTSDQGQQNMAYHGFVEMINGTIENANNGVSLAGVNSSGRIDWDKTGGLIQATNSNFFNNKRDVEFLSYHNRNVAGKEIPNRSFFKNCEFQTNTNNKIEKLSAHVTMWDVNGVGIYGCDFEDTRSSIDPKTDGRTGLFTIDAGYTVMNHCTTLTFPPCTTDPTRFLNLNSCIQSYSNNNGIIKIQYSEFNSYKGVYFNKVSHAVVRSNLFYIEHDELVSGSTDYPYGLYLDQSNSFNTEGNQFTGTTGATNVVNGGAAGIVVRNTGENNSDIYRSHFDNLKMACQALDGNKAAGAPYGLRFICNDYEDDWNDIDIRQVSSGPLQPNAGIAEKQGVPENSFGNASPILNLNIENNAGSIRYWYPGSNIQANRLFPYQTSGTMFPPWTFPANGCVNRINNWGVSNVSDGTATGTIDGYKPTELTIRTQRDGLTDDGNTETLITAVQTATTGNITTVLTQLQNASPYLSIKVLGLVASMEAPSPFTNTMVRDILFLNPHSARSTWIQSVLDNRTNLLSSGDRTIINSNSNVYTHRDTLEDELSDIYEAYDAVLNEILHYHMSDTIYDLDSIHPWLKHPNNINHHYRLAELYFADGDWANFNLVVDSIPLIFSLNPSQETYHNTFNELYDELHSWQLSDTSIYQPDSARLSWLLEFVDEHAVYPTYVHSLLAVQDTSLLFPDVVIPFDDSGSVPNILVIRELEQENKKSDISLYPNPAKDEVFMKWKTDFKPSTVKLMDINGKVIQETKWSKNEEINISLESVPSGMYFVKIIFNEKNQITRKLIIRR